MRATLLLPLALLLVQALGTSGLLVVLFAARHQLGLVPLNVTIGVLQLFQSLLAVTFYVQLAPGVLVGPGSVVVSTANLFTLLLVYIRDDALEARRLAYGIIGASVLASLLLYLTGVLLASPLVFNLSGAPPALFTRGLRVSIASTAAIAVDVLAIILVYEAVSRVVRHNFFARIWIAMTLVLALDTVIFSLGAFAGEPRFTSIFLSSLIGKSISGLLFAALLRLYLHIGGRSQPHGPRGAVRDVFHLLTFRQKYEVMTQLVYRDALTGLYSRRFLDEILPRELSLAQRSERPLALMMIDLDHFKAVNDSYGHQVGDEALKSLALFLHESVRSTDVVCRFGGEEFIVVLSDTTGEDAVALAEKLLERLKELQASPDWVLPVGFTVTCGVAGFPDDGDEPEILIRTADMRLYRGKDQGRDRVVGEAG